MILNFKHVGGGLVAKDGELTGFTIAGEDKKFYNATAKIEGETVVVSSDKVPNPKAVRYGWAKYPIGNLWNKEGLPASPFRTRRLSGDDQGRQIATIAVGRRGKTNRRPAGGATRFLARGVPPPQHDRKARIHV